jgi:hypothetical protein
MTYTFISFLALETYAVRESFLSKRIVNQKYISWGIFPYLEFILNVTRHTALSVNPLAMASITAFSMFRSVVLKLEFTKAFAHKASTAR